MISQPTREPILLSTIVDAVQKSKPLSMPYVGQEIERKYLLNVVVQAALTKLISEGVRLDDIVNDIDNHPWDTRN